MRNVNIKDVAKKAGVAVSTVSRVLNDHTDVKKETKDRVLKVIKELNYIPNTSARNLKRSSSNSVGIFVLGEYNPFFGDIVESLENEISKKGFSVMVHFHHANQDAIESASEFILEKKLIGLIYLGGVVSKDKERFLSGLEAPTVFTSTVIEDGVNRDLFSSVIISEYKAVSAVVDYLVSLGHKKIGIIAAETEGLCTSPERYSAFRSIVKKKGLEFKEDFIVSGDYSIQSGFDSMNELLKRKTGITAVFSVSDMMAIGACNAVITKGLKVPGDYSIVGFDGLDYGKFFIPSITTVKQPNIEFAKKSCEILFGIIQNDDPVQHIVLDTEFIIRESCNNIK